MLRTISIGSTLQMQGVPVGTAPDGKLLVRVGKSVYAGQPVPRWNDHVRDKPVKRLDPPNLNAS